MASRRYAPTLAVGLGAEEYRARYMPEAVYHRREPIAGGGILRLAALAGVRWRRDERPTGRGFRDFRTGTRGGARGTTWQPFRNLRAARRRSIPPRNPFGSRTRRSASSMGASNAIAMPRARCISG